MNPGSDAPPDTAALYVVATPIGNLGDITVRALDVFKSCSFIICEDTRRTRRLLDHYAIDAELIAIHRFNEEKGAPRIIARLAKGESCAYVSEGGTPAVSDPGARLVQRVRGAGFPVIVVPGASAVTAVMSIAGWENGFLFAGFVEKKKAARKRQIALLAALPWAAVLFEAPSRIKATLADMQGVLGSRNILLAREMTKFFEQVIQAPAGKILDELPDPVKGEIALVIYPEKKAAKGASPAPADLTKIMKACRDMTAGGVKPMKAAAIASLLTGVDKKTILRLTRNGL